MARPSVAVCTGKDCRRRGEHGAVVTSLAEVADVVPVRCLGICAGPVVVVRPDDGPVVLSKVRTSKQRRQLVRTVAHDRALKPTLAAREVTGMKRLKALRRLARTR